MKNYSIYLGALAFLLMSVFVYNCSKITDSIRGKSSETKFSSEITTFDVLGKENKQLLFSSIINDVTLTYEARQDGSISTSSLRIDINAGLANTVSNN